MLFQKGDGIDHVIAYACRGLNKKKEIILDINLNFLALKWAITEKCQDYLYGSKKFTVLTDDNPRNYVPSIAKKDATCYSLVTALSAFDFDIFYGPGRNNSYADADALSKLSCVQHNEYLPIRREYQDYIQHTYETL